MVGRARPGLVVMLSFVAACASSSEPPPLPASPTGPSPSPTSSPSAPSVDASALPSSDAGTDAVVEGHRISCSHYDAYRFFTPEAVELNTRRPTFDTRASNEQPGCLHAGMDVYKWAYKLAPFTSAALIADCFALAREIRELDMRASPYDLREWGYSPVAIETPAGKADYVAAQRGFAVRAAELRRRLIAVADAVLADAQPAPSGQPG